LYLSLKVCVAVVLVLILVIGVSVLVNITGFKMTFERLNRVLL